MKIEKCEIEKRREKKTIAAEFYLIFRAHHQITRPFLKNENKEKIAIVGTQLKTGFYTSRIKFTTKPHHTIIIITIIPRKHWPFEVQLLQFWAFLPHDPGQELMAFLQ